MYISELMAAHVNEFARFNWASSDICELIGELFVRRMSDQLAAQAKHTSLGQLEMSKHFGSWTWRVKGRNLEELGVGLVEQELIVVPELKALLELYLGGRKDLEKMREGYRGKRYPEGLKEELRRHGWVVRGAIDDLRLILADKRMEERPVLGAGPGRPKGGGKGRHTMTGGELKAKRRRQRNRKSWKGLS